MQGCLVSLVPILPSLMGEDDLEQLLQIIGPNIICAMFVVNQPFLPSFFFEWKRYFTLGLKEFEATALDRLLPVGHSGLWMRLRLVATLSWIQLLVMPLYSKTWEKEGGCSFSNPYG